jgi:hypothetical protein
MRSYTEIITTELFTGDEQNPKGNNNNIYDHNSNHHFLGMCQLKGVLLRAYL